jgi:hypothetical protein
MKLAAKDPTADAVFKYTEDIARQLFSEEFVKASLRAENPAVYRANIAGAFIASADEARQLTQDAMEPMVKISTRPFTRMLCRQRYNSAI